MFKDVITLNRNARGCYILDTVKGCSYVNQEKGGCYGDCYAFNIASRYGMDFSTPVNRGFIQDKKQIYFPGFYDGDHENDIIRAIKKIEMPFVRIGEMGDPSEDWEHTVNVCEKIAPAGKPVVIITKHWKVLTEKQKARLKKLDVCINTSVSAMDTGAQIKHRLKQQKELSSFCNSVLRVVSCDFDRASPRFLVQDELLREPVINTVFRPRKNNPMVLSGEIKVSKVKFLTGQVLASICKPGEFMGHCKDCPDMCGIRRNHES